MYAILPKKDCVCIVGLSVKDGEGVSAAEGVRNVGKKLRGRLGGLEAKRIERRSRCNHPVKDDPASGALTKNN